jgi:glycosyltransferase involved in cell wall biosynthesis
MLPSRPVVTPRIVYLEPLWNLHAFQRQMQAYPPPGYAFVTGGSVSRSVVKATARWKSSRSLLKAADILLPTSLAKAWVGRWTSCTPETVLTYAVDHVVFRQEPWVVEVEYAAALVGVRPQHFARYRALVSRLLASPFCRRIVCWSEAGRRSLADLGWERFEEKTDLIYLAVPPKPVVRRPDPKRVKLLFVGSGTSGGAFEGRGSEIFEVFAALRGRYPQLDLVVRSDVPGYIREQYGGLPGLRIIERRVSDDMLEREFQGADIFIFPSYHTLPFTILEAMSYGLPVVTIDSWANAEYVQNEITGLVVPRPSRLPPCYPGTRQPSFLHAAFREAVRRPDAECVAALVSAVSALIDQPDLRHRLGRAARHEVERGTFSLARMNANLSRFFDLALTSATL